MAGIYIHIPFCKQACHYCNFHFSTSLRHKDQMIQAICDEIRLRRDYLGTSSLETIYFGGGTPSLLSVDDLILIFDTLRANFTWKTDCEITLEANPDDLTAAKIQAFRKSGINRLSIGIQSFFDDDLTYMHRAHNAQEGDASVKLAQDHGITNISIDLIYGSPTTADDMWHQNLEKAVSLGIPHISSYCLTVEPKTLLAKQIKRGLSQPPSSDRASTQFGMLIDHLMTAGYDHYEISNFALPDQYAIHNTNYWRGETYLGIGPSAHSFDQTSRAWNIAHNAKYIDAIKFRELPIESEILSPQDRYNEYIMTSLRTMWGIDLNKIKTFDNAFMTHFMSEISPHIEQKMVVQEGDFFRLTSEGKYFADRIAMELFWVSR